MQHRRPLVAVASRSAPSSTQAAQVAHLRRAHRLAAWGLALLLGACTGDISPQRVTVADGGHPGDGGPTATGATQAQTVGPEGGTLALDGAQLTIPAGALSAPVTIRISRTLEAVPSSFTAHSPVYRFEPEGLVFQLPVEVALPFTGEVTAPVVYWSLLGVSGYERLPTRVEGALAIAQVVHFSAGFVVDGDPLPPVPTFAGSTITFSWPNPAGMAPLLHMTWPSAVDVTSTAATMAYDICQSSVADGCDSFFATYATDAPDPAAPCRVVVSAAGAVTSQCELWNLPTGSKQYFAIRARDTAGTPSQSILRGWTRGDNEPPVLFGSPTFGCQGTSRIDLTFPGATDLVTMPAYLVYEVCTSTLEGGCRTFTASSDNAIYSTAHAGQPCVNTWTTPGQMLECHFDNLSLRTKNYFTIRAKDEAGNPSTVPWTGSFVCDDAPPHLGASALDFTWTTPRTLQVSWNSAWDTRTTFEKMAHDICESTDPSGCNSFRAVYRSDDPRPSAPCKQVLRTQPSGNTVWNGECDFSSLDPRVTHYFAVRARDEAGNPSPEILTGSTLGDGTPPVMYVGSPPTFNCSGTPTIDMSWAGGSDPNYSGAAWTGVAYDICESDTPEGCNTFAPTYSTDDPDPAAPCKVTLAANGYTVTNACQFTNLSLSQKHYFAIRARDLAGNPSVDVLRSSFVCDETPPSQATWGVEFFEWRSPTELKMGFKSGSDQRTPATRLAYDVCVSPLYDGCAGAAFYPMYRTDDPSPTRACRVVAAAPPFDDLASNECRFGNLDPDVFIWVYVWVRARDEAGNPSAIVPMPPERGYNWRPFAPDTPTFSDVTPHTATVRWAPRPDDPQGDRYFDYTYFELCQSTEPNGCTPFTATYQMRGPAKAISGLTIGTTYYFSVRTMNSDQTYSAPSPIAALEAVDVSPPTTPTNLRNTFAGAAYIRVEWDESTDAGSLQSALQYQICQSTSSTGCDPFVPTTSPGWDGWFAYSRQDGFWRGWQVGPFPSSTAFYFSVRAKDETGNLSAASPPVRLMNRDTTVPRRPVAPTFSAVNSTSMVVSWPPTDDNVTAANQLVYQLTVDTATAGCPALHTEYLTNPGVTSQPVTGLAVGCAYSFFLSARDEAGNWSLRGPSAFQTTVDTTPPAAPTGLRTVLLNAGSTLLAWDAPLDNFSPSAALRYEVCVGEGAAGCTPFHHSGDTGAGVFLYTASPLTSSTVYSFAVKAIDQAQNVSDASAVFTWRTSDITPPTPPGAPTFSDLSSISMTVSWSAASDLVSAASALVYEVTQDGASSGCASVHRSYTTLPGVTSWVVPDLTVGCTYSFRVRAKDEAGNRSDPGPAATSPPVPDTLAPSVPGLVTILSTSYNAITLGWTASSDNATAQASLLYEVCQTTDSGGCAPFHASATTAAGGLTYTASSLTPSTTYYFAVRAKDGSGNVSAPTALLSQATAALPRPTFAGLSAVSSVTGSSATLTWAPATDQNTLLENLVYRVCQSTSAGACAQSFAASATTAPGATSYVVSGLQSGLPVYFVVRARNELGLDDANTVERSVTPVALASYAYVVNPGKSSIMRYGVNRRSGALTGPRTMTMVAQPAAFAVEPLGRRGFVTIGSAGSLGLCTLDPVTGESTQAGGATTGTTPGAVAVAPSGRFVYTANGGDNTLSLFSVDAGTGALAAAGSATVGNGPRALALHPLGRALYVVNGSDATVSSHSVDAATGSLSPLGVIPTGAGPTSVVVDPQGRFVYVANGGATTISAYAIDPATGTLSAGVEQAAGATPGALAVDPSGRFLYAVHPSAATVSAFAIEAATGALTAVAAVSTGPGPAGVSVEPSGHFAYVANQTGGTVSIYSIDGTTGALTPTRKVTTGGAPTSVVFAQASYDPAGSTEPGEPRFSAVTETALTISWDASKVKISREEFQDRLRKGNPSIEVMPGKDCAIGITSWNLQPGQEKVVALRLKEEFVKASV